MGYTVKSIFKTIQGEGANAGRVAVFCRFSGCNLWSGREEDRSDAACNFCDTDFVGGKRYETADELADAIEVAWCARGKHKFVVFTGGEPFLQLDEDLVRTLRYRGFYTAAETNGTKLGPGSLDWVCVSPKAGTELVKDRGSEMKVVYPQDGLDPETYLSAFFSHFWIQPKDGVDRGKNTAAAIAYCLENPRWKLSVQTHKLIGVR